MRRIIDITVTVTPQLPSWPGEPKLTTSLLRDMDRGDSCTVSRIEGGVHTGTHLDAPRHFIAGGIGVDELALEVLIGPARVAHFPDTAVVDAAMLESLALPAGTTRLLLKTRNSALWNDPGHAFREDYVALTPDAAQWIVDRGIKLVGIDYLSIERFREPGHRTHKILLGAGVIAVEGLNLRQAAPGDYDLYCLPLKLAGADGAPARAVLIAND
jgi:arylformamidase